MKVPFLILATVAVFATPAYAQELVGFKTPTSNIYCQQTDGDDVATLLRCEIREINRVPPQPRASACYDWGHTFAMLEDGQSYYECDEPDSVVNEDLLTLSYGSIWRRAGFTCKSEQTGLACGNSRRHGFFLSKNAQRLF